MLSMNQVTDIFFLVNSKNCLNFKEWPPLSPKQFQQKTNQLNKVHHLKILKKQ